MAAENSGDFAFFTHVAAEDVVLMPPSAPSVVGRAATVAFMQEFLERFDLQIRYSSDEVQVRGDLAFDRGTYSQTVTPRGGGAPIRESGQYLWLYARRADGSWEFLRVIWNIG